jgi:alanyl-tRNA synthetase
MGNTMAQLLANNVAPTEKNAVYYLPKLDAEALRTFANVAGERVKGALVALTDGEGDFKYVIHYDSPELSSLVKSANSALIGKGGGRQPMAEGGFRESLEKIKSFFES